MAQSFPYYKGTVAHGRASEVFGACSETPGSQGTQAGRLQVVVPLWSESKLPWGCSDSAIGIPLSSSKVPQKESQPTSNWRHVEACVGVLILFAGLRRPNSIKDWLVRLGDRYKVDVNVQDCDRMNGRNKIW